ncbi:MAG: sigma 54-interacting transcriptional regulator [Anaeromyxobacter sp.]
MTAQLNPSFAVLLVDDEPAWLRASQLALERAAGITHVLTCEDPARAMELLQGNDVGIVLLDLNMPRVTGEELLARITAEHPGVSVIVVSGMNQVEAAVRCMRLGAYDYHVKTEEEDRLVAAVLRAVQLQRLQRESLEVSTRLLTGELHRPEAFAELATQDRTMLTLFAYVEAVAGSPQPLLVTGERGVGKALIARAAHALSGLAGPLVQAPLGGLDEAAADALLYGRARGPAGEPPVRGKVEEAADGTLFLDEIGDLPAPSQLRLLRFLQDGEYTPLGSERPRRAKVRLVAASRKDLAARERAGLLRRDLLYRLRTHRVRVPPLRERKADLPLLLERLLDEAARTLGKKRPTPPRQLVQLLATHDWPGNVDELRDMVFEAVRVHQGRVLSMEVFAEAIGRQVAADGPASEGNPFTGLERLPSFDGALRLLVEEAMERAGGNQTLAARLVGVSQSALSKRLKAYRG